jgi:hypothetical protein
MTYAIETDRLDDAAAMFHDFPCRATAQRYELIAIAYCNAMVIAPQELENILWLVLSYLETKQGSLA